MTATIDRETLEQSLLDFLTSLDLDAQTADEDETVAV